MRKINEKDFVNYTISGNGWNYTITEWKNALREWNNVGTGCTLYGNRSNNTRAIIDTK